MVSGGGESAGDEGGGFFFSSSRFFKKPTQGNTHATRNQRLFPSRNINRAKSDTPVLSSKRQKKKERKKERKAEREAARPLEPLLGGTKGQPRIGLGVQRRREGGDRALGVPIQSKGGSSLSSPGAPSLERVRGAPPTASSPRMRPALGLNTRGPGAGAAAGSRC